MTDLHPTLHPTIKNIPMPARIAALPLTENGYPILFFADYVDGKPDLRVMSGIKLVTAVKKQLCWLCGQPLGITKTFVLGPMCCVTRTSSEPPCHYDCAEYAAKACPFLTRPKAVRREVGLPEDTKIAGIGIKRNPGVCALWTTQSYKVWSPDNEGILFTVGEPNRVEFWAEGRQATYVEVAESIESGAPALIEQTYRDQDPDDSLAVLGKQFAGILPYFRNLPGRDERKPEAYGMNEAVMIAARASELTWFATNPDEQQYIRPALAGETPDAFKPTHVRICKLDEAGHKRSREFGTVTNGEFKPLQYGAQEGVEITHIRDSVVSPPVKLRKG